MAPGSWESAKNLQNSPERMICHIFWNKVIFHKPGTVTFLPLWYSLTLCKAWLVYNGLQVKVILIHSRQVFWSKSEKYKNYFINSLCCFIHFKKQFRYFYSKLLITGVYRVSQKKCIDFAMSYLKKYWIWPLQIVHSNLAWVEIV